jgi:hypothetical protein
MHKKSYCEKLLDMRRDSYYDTFISSEDLMTFLGTFNGESQRGVLGPGLFEHYAKKGLGEMSIVFISALKKRAEMNRDISPLDFLEAAMECDKMVRYWDLLPIFLHHLPDVVKSGLGAILSKRRAVAFSETLMDALHDIGFYDTPTCVSIPLGHGNIVPPSGWETKEMFRVSA